MPNRTFLLYTDTYEPLKLLSLEEAGTLFLAIYDYVINGVILKTDNRLLAFAFSVFREKLDMDAERYEEVCEKRRNAGRKGSEARWGNPANIANANTEMAKIANAINANSKMASVANTITIQEQYDNDNKNKNNKEKNININIDAKKEKQQDNLAKRKDTFTQSVKAFATIYGDDMTNEFIDYWTEPNKSGTKMRYELERTWDLSRRIKRWASNRINQPNNNNNGNNKGHNEQESARERSIREANESIERTFAAIDARRLQQNNEEVPDIILPW